MGYDAKTERLIALKKLAGKAQTSNDKGLANEALPSGITSTSETIFGEAVTASPSSTSLYTITGKVEYLRFQVSFIAGSDTSSGRHGFELKLPADYEANSTNSKAGTGVFVDDGVVNASGGILQIVPPSFATAYEAKPYYGGSATKGSGTQIPLLDPRDWYLDYFNGVFFQQDPPGSGDHANNPDYIEAFLYIGDMVDTVISNNAGGGTGDNKAEYLVLTPTGSLQAERVFTPALGLSGTDGGAGSPYTLKILDSIVATLTGSQFSGNVGITGSLEVRTGDFRVESAGEDQALFLDASANTLYINKGSTGFTTVIKNTNNEVFRAGAGGAIFNEYGNKFIDFRIESWNKPYAFYIDSNQDHVLILSGGGVTSPDESTYTDMNFFVSGSIGSRNSTTKGTSIFGGDVLSSGSFLVQSGITGSLTHLPDGTSYLRAGSNITITSGSDGSISIAGTSGGTARSKDVYVISSNVNAGDNVAVSSTDFSSASYDPNKIDVFLNGQLVHSGSVSQVNAGSRDYYVSSATSLKFSFRVQINDILDVIVFAAS